MSPTIDLNVDYNDVKDSDKFPVVPGGTYAFVVKDIETTQAGSGRPMLNWQLTVTDPDTNKPINVFHRTVLPWIPPGQTSLDVGGVFMLVGACKGVGLPWEGGKITTENYIGRGGQVKLKQVTKNVKNDGDIAPDKPIGEYVPDPEGEQVNEVEKFIY